MAHPGWLDLLAEAGMRVCIAPMFRSGRWYTKNGHMVEYAWDEAAGEKAMGEALSLIERAEQHPSAACSAWWCRRRSIPAPRGCCATRSPRRRRAACRGRSTRRSRSASSTRSRGGMATRRSAGWITRPAVGTLDHRSRHFPRRSSIDALAHRYRCEATGGNRHDRRALPDRVRPARHHAEGFRPLPPCRREHGRGHRHLSAQHARRDAAGLPIWRAPRPAIRAR